MGGKGGGDGSYTANAAANSGAVFDRTRPGTDQPTSTADIPPTVVAPPPPTDTTMPTMGDDAKTPSDTGNTATTGSDASDGSGTSTGAVASSLLSAPQYWFNQPVSTLAPGQIKSKLKTTSGSV